MIRVLPLTAILLFIYGCSTGSAMRIGAANHPPTKPGNVLVYLDPNTINREYEVIGLVSAEKTAGWTFTNVNEEKVINILISKAATIGGDAIIIQSIENSSKPWAVQGAGGSSSLDKKSARASVIKFK